MQATTSDADLTYHLRELRDDLAALSQSVSELLPLLAADAASQIDCELVGICAGIEHDYVVHSANALDLARSPPPAPERSACRPEEELDRSSDERWTRAAGPMPEGRSAEDLLRELRPHVEGLSAILSEPRALVARVEAQRSRPSEDHVQVDDLLERVHASLFEAMGRAFSAMQLAIWLDRLVNPEEQGEDEEDGDEEEEAE